MLVYLATNNNNGKMYVGQTTKKLNLRWNEHTSNKSSSPLHRALRRYGKENFSLETLHVCASKEEMDFAEIFYINLLNTKAPLGYNLTDGGEGRQGYHLSEESKKKISEKNSGKKMSLAQRIQISKRHKGIKLGPRSEAVKEKISKAHLGKKPTEETRRRQSLAKLGKKRAPFTDETKLRMSIAKRLRDAQKKSS